MRSYIIFFIIGIIALPVAWGQASMGDNSLSRLFWPKTRAMVVYKSIRTEKGFYNRPDSHRPSVRVRFSIDGKVLEAEIRGLSDGVDVFDRAQVEDLLSEFPVEGEIAIRRNPDNPTYIVRPVFNIWWLTSIAAGIVGLFCMAMGLRALLAGQPESMEEEDAGASEMLTPDEIEVRLGTSLDEIFGLVFDDRKIEAIKRVRELTGCDLKSAKDYLDSLG